jgi:hypothetical protein
MEGDKILAPGWQTSKWADQEPFSTTLFDMVIEKEKKN